MGVSYAASCGIFCPTMADIDGPIGLFDSGIGGCTVLSEVRRRLPNEHLLYLADQAHCPYGPRTPEELCILTQAGVSWLIQQRAKLIVVACNSASAAALGYLRQVFPNMPFVGMVPAVKPAVLATRTGVIGVLATPATIAGGLLQTVMNRYARDVQVLLQPCEGLADAVESGGLNTPATRDLITTYVAPLVAAGADTLVLGCTHYPFLANQIREVAGSGVVLIDPAPAIAEQVARILASQGMNRQSDHAPMLCCVTTGDRDTFSEQLARLQIAPCTIQETNYVLEDSLATRHADWP